MSASDPLTVLLIEDNPGDARLFREYLRESGQEIELLWKDKLKSGLDVLANGSPDVVAVDLGLPDSGGVETVSRCVEAGPSVPVVVLTGQQELDVAMAALEAGATEYLQKNELTPSLAARTLRWALEQSRMEEQLGLLSEAVDQSTEAVLITEAEPLDEPGPRIVYANPAFEEMTGYQKDEVIGRTPRLMQGPETDRYALEQLREALEAGESWEGEMINYRKDGTPFILQWSMSPVRDAADEISYWVSVQRDVTETRRMWERLLDVQEEERRRIDQEIHDEMGGLLATLQMKAQLVRQQAEDNGLSTVPTDELTDLLGELSVAIRTIARQLHPRVLDSFGLSEALSNLAGKLEEQHDLSVVLRMNLETEQHYSSLVERTAYRVVHEAAINVSRHAATDTVEVLLTETETELHIEVKDEGQGFDLSDHDEDSSYGLKGIRDRVERLNGTVEIDSIPGEGTTISARLPLETSTLPPQWSDPAGDRSTARV